MKLRCLSLLLHQEYYTYTYIYTTATWYQVKCSLSNDEGYREDQRDLYTDGLELQQQFACNVSHFPTGRPDMYGSQL